MLKNKFYIAVVVLGLCLVICGFVFSAELSKTINGICYGIGAGLIGMGAANLVMKRIEEKNADLKTRLQIEALDERNILIRDRAKAASADIVQWLLAGLIVVLILVNAPLWQVFVVLGIFLTYHIFMMYYMQKLQKEL